MLTPMQKKMVKGLLCYPKEMTASAEGDRGVGKEEVWWGGLVKDAVVGEVGMGAAGRWV